MAKASEQMEKALKVSECVPEIGTELHRERLLSKLLGSQDVNEARRKCTTKPQLQRVFGCRV